MDDWKGIKCLFEKLKKEKIKRIKTTPPAIAPHGQNTHYTHTRSLKKIERREKEGERKRKKKKRRRKRAFPSSNLAYSCFIKVNMLNPKL